MSDKPKTEPVVIKKYANRRLYNTATSSYVTLEHLAELVRKGTDFVVYDAKSGDDITRSVLAQIIFEEENKGASLLPISFLQQLIRIYGDSVQSFLPSYLELSMDAFTRNQEKLKERFAGVFTANPSFKIFEEQIRQNMALVEKTMEMFSPFAGTRPQGGEAAKPAKETPEAASGSQRELAALRNEMENMRAQIDALQKRNNKPATDSD